MRWEGIGQGLVTLGIRKIDSAQAISSAFQDGGSLSEAQQAFLLKGKNNFRDLISLHSSFTWRENCISLVETGNEML